VKNAAGVVVSTVAVQSDADGSALAFSNGTYAVKTVAPATAGALSTITFGGATINNADAATNNTAAAAPSTAIGTGTTAANALPVLTVPSTAPSAIIGQTNAVTGVSFADADDNIGFTATVKAAGTSQVVFSSIATTTTVDGVSTNVYPILKDASGSAAVANQGANTLVITGSKLAVNAQLANLSYTSNASEAGSESLTVTVTDAKGGVASKVVPVSVAKLIPLASSTAPTANLTGTANDDQFTGSLSNFNTYYTTYSVAGNGGNDKLILSAVNGTFSGLATGIGTLDLTLTASSALTVTSTRFGSSLQTVKATGDYPLAGTFNSGTVFNIAAATSVAQNGLTITNLLSPSTSALSTVLTDKVTVNLVNTVTGNTAPTTLTSITDTAGTVDVLNINSNGSVANTITTIGTLATNATINIAGPAALTIGTMPALGTTGSVNASAAEGKITLTAASAATITGGSAADSITGSANADSINGGLGNDTISGAAGSNTISGADGDDSLVGGAGNDTISGGLGNDNITGGGASDVLSGNEGNDTITGNTSNDTIDGGDGADSIVGGGGADSLAGGAGNDTITGGTGADAINGGAGADVLTGGITGANTYTFTLGDSGNTAATRDSITDLKTGDKIIFGGYGITGLTSGSNLVNAASSSTAKEIYIDSVTNRIVIETAVDGSTVEEIAIPASVGKAAFTYNYGADSVVGTADDYLTVGAAPLTKTNDGLGKLSLVGNTIADITVSIESAGSPTVGGEVVSGGIVRTLTGAEVTGGGMVVTGSTGNDIIIGSAQADTITGGTGADKITASAGVDVIHGDNASGGNVSTTDTLVLSQASSGTLIQNAGLAALYSGGPTVAMAFIDLASTSAQTLSTGNTVAIDNIENLDASGQLNTSVSVGVWGTAAANSIVGGAGSDFVRGYSDDTGSGTDSIVGNGGVDFLRGSGGGDLIFGGSQTTIPTGATVYTESTEGTLSGTNAVWTANLGTFGTYHAPVTANANILEGRIGTDTIVASTGKDVIVFQVSADGTGDATGGTIGTDVIHNFKIGQDLLLVTNYTGGGDYTFFGSTATITALGTAPSGQNSGLASTSGWSVSAVDTAAHTATLHYVGTTGVGSTITNAGFDITFVGLQNDSALTANAASANSFFYTV
jgi:Ca2+-binding RTX toxin-like protein